MSEKHDQVDETVTDDKDEAVGAATETTATETTDDAAKEAQPVEFSVVFDEDDGVAQVPYAVDDVDDADDDEGQVPFDADDADDASETDGTADGDETEPAADATGDTTADRAADANPTETSAAATAANARRVNETLALAAQDGDVSAHADPNEIKASVRRSEHALDNQVGDRVLLKSYPTFSLNHATTTNRRTGRHVLDDVSIACYAGSLYAIRVLSDEDDPEQRVTLMEVLGGFQIPTAGTAMTKSSNLAELEINELRGHRLGLVPQRYAVRGDLDAEANVRYAMDASGRTYLKPKPVIARELLERVGFNEATSGKPMRDLAEVDRRRVAIARALSCEAETVILDEPTKGLDAADASAILDLLASIAHARDPKRAVVIVTASDEVADAADQVFRLAD
ncbi:ATP-binding cassette domain-containing protein [Bifidobacterium platyrrhinorum]|uniref:ATP-binding cassette domain-containing protein n=1 Tax=Bifidobacterium platyrrhinorum TaxID=2661628 RepID=A0A6L9SRT9_9BIFI|nr:ATP-binding cassette domain-containing protein [Bifidobacterium platyrrhinorum]NEG55250.1 ATP-binding cassette domain-containing protein [Bifidobacterium platyrrhinorum]